MADFTPAAAGSGTLYGLSPELAAEAQAKGMDLSTLAKIWEVLIKFGPEAVSLLRRIIDYLNGVPVFGAPPASLSAALPAAPAGAGHHCDHEELCKRTLDAAICAACCAARHYHECCEEHAHAA